ncbi:hypothetical protein C8J57DRAFT_1368809 [Mycena rebaudengoi]|nr:hypothetical protein C8J57DRAFT_1368809 [Mycena rebaudengoi]
MLISSTHRFEAEIHKSQLQVRFSRMIRKSTGREFCPSVFFTHQNPKILVVLTLFIVGDAIFVFWTFLVTYPTKRRAVLLDQVSKRRNSKSIRAVVLECRQARRNGIRLHPTSVFKLYGPLHQMEPFVIFSPEFHSRARRMELAPFQGRE